MTKSDEACEMLHLRLASKLNDSEVASYSHQEHTRKWISRLSVCQPVSGDCDWFEGASLRKRWLFDFDYAIATVLVWWLWTNREQLPFAQRKTEKKPTDQNRILMVAITVGTRHPNFLLKRKMCVANHVDHLWNCVLPVCCFHLSLHIISVTISIRLSIVGLCVNVIEQ